MKSHSFTTLLRLGLLCCSLFAIGISLKEAQARDESTAVVLSEDSLESIEDLIYESGPYPRMLTLRIPEKFSKKGNEWKVNVVELLAKDGLAVIDMNTSGDLKWRPANEDDSMVRTNYDRNYEKLDYSVVLGSLDVEILSTTAKPAQLKNSSKSQMSVIGEAKLKESIEKNPLYSKLFPLLPKEIQQNFSSNNKTIRFSNERGNFTLLDSK